MYPSNAIQSNPPVILVVDDDQYSRDILRRMLLSDGYQVEEAENGLQALEKYDLCQPAAVLLDIQMPGLNGYEVCTRLQDGDHARFIPVIMMTALDEQEPLDRAFACGASDYVTKPFYWPVLRHRVRRLVLTTHIMQELDDHRNHLEQLVAARTAELLTANEALQQEVIARRNAEARQSALTVGLREVMAAANELMAAPDRDSLYRQAVELAREKLGVERCALFLEREHDLQGTYGTDQHGKTTDEHRVTIPKSASQLDQFQSLASRDQRWLLKDAPHTEWDGQAVQQVGEGWIGVSRVYAAERSIGVFFNDAAITHAPLDPVKQEIISVYCSIVGAVIERKAIEETLQHKGAYLAALHAATMGLVERLDLEQALEAIIQRAGELVGAPHGYLYVIEPMTQELVVKVGVGRFEKALGHKLSIGQGIAGRVWQTGNILAVEDYSKWSGRDTDPEFDSLKAVVGLPLRSGAEMVGVLGLAFADNERRFGDAEIEILTRFGELASIALHNSRLYTEIQQELTERRRAEEALSHERDLLQALMDNIPDSIYFKDTASRFTRINHAQANILSLQCPDAALGQTDFDFQLGDLAHQFFEEEQHLLRTGQPIVDRLEFNPASDGKDRWFSATKVPFRDRTGQIVGLVGVSRDVTEYKHLETTLRQALDKQNELNELKSRFITMASHEFRTPLTTISSSTGLLKLGSRRLTEDQHLHHFSKIQMAVRQMVQLLDDVLTFGQAEADHLPFRPEVLDLEKFCQEIVEELQGSSGDSPRMVFCSQAGSSQLMADPKLLRQILTNLLTNAVKYSPSGTQIQVDLSCKENVVELEVKDQGIGISEKDQAHLFEPFHRAGNVGTIHGTGLGLAITRKAVELHGGTIGVTSQLEVGTTFTVRLPLVQETQR